MTVNQQSAKELASAAIALANDLLDCCTYKGRYTAPMSDIRQWRKARQQAGRLLTISDSAVPDLIDFMEDFGGIKGHKLCLDLVKQ